MIAGKKREARNNRKLGKQDTVSSDWKEDYSMQDKHKEEGTPGVYTLNAIYIVLSILAYIYVFWQLGQRWPVG